MLLLAKGSAPPSPLHTPSLPAKLALFLNAAKLEWSDEKYYILINKPKSMIVLVEKIIIFPSKNYANLINTFWFVVRQPNMHKHFQQLVTTFVIM